MSFADDTGVLAAEKRLAQNAKKMALWDSAPPQKYIWRSPSEEILI